MKLVAIGDIHGQVWKLRDLLQKLHDFPLEEGDRLIFLGDYIDRGPEVSLTLDLLLRLREDHPDVVFLRGNHDQAMLDVREYLDPDRETKLQYDDVSWWFQYGGGSTIASYGGGSEWYRKVPAEHWEFLESTQIQHDEGGYIFVHAGLLPPGKKWIFGEEPRLWIREWFLESHADFGGVVVFGHTPMRDGQPLVESNKIGIDTAAAYGGPLTAALLDPGNPAAVRFVQAQ